MHRLFVSQPLMQDDKKHIEMHSLFWNMDHSDEVRSTLPRSKENNGGGI